MSSSPENLEAATDLYLFGSNEASDESEAAPDDTTAQPPSVKGASGIDDNTDPPPSVKGASGIRDESEAAHDDTIAQPPSIKGASGIEDNIAQPPSVEGASGIQELIENDNNISPDKKNDLHIHARPPKCGGIQSEGQRAICRLLQ